MTHARIEQDGRVATVTLDRADKLNAFDRHLYRAANEALAGLAADDGVSVVVLTGTGRAFSAGVDLGELAATASGESDPAFTEPATAFISTIAEFPKPLVAAVNGLAVGIGTTLLGYCDVVIAAESARFRYPFTSLGVTPELGSSWMLPHQVGWQAAQWLFLSSAWLEARRAAEIGLVLEVVPDTALAERAARLAADIATHPLASLMATKRTYTAWRRDPQLRAQEVESADFQRLLQAG